MTARRNEISPAELTSEAGGLMTGLGVLTVMAAPFAVPGLLLALLLALPLIALGLPLLAAWLLVRGVARLVHRTRPASAGEQADARAERRQITAWTGT